MNGYKIANPTILARIPEEDLRELMRGYGYEPHFVTGHEPELMHQLMIRAGRPISHARLLNAVWGPEYCTRLEYLRTFMYQLRKKIEDDSLHPQYLITDPGLGYRFAERV